MQNKLYLFTSSCFSLVRSFCLIISLIVPSATMSMGFPNLSPAEYEALEREMAEYARQIDEYVSTLSPEEQEEFHRTVAEVEQMMENMSEEELAGLFEQALSAEQEFAEQALAQPTAPLIEEKPQEVSVSKIVSSEEEEALQLLDDIIRYTDLFMEKVQPLPDISVRVNRWIAQGNIQTTQANWDAIKNQIESTKQRFYSLKATDAKTQKYLFIEPLVTNTTLYQSLQTLRDTLATYEPQVQASSFGIEKLSATSKNAIVLLLNTYATLIQTISPELDNVFKGYEPEAQKIKEAEQKQAALAEKQAGQTRRAGTVRVAGQEQQPSFGRGYQQPSYGGDYYDYGSMPSGYRGPSEVRPFEPSRPKEGKPSAPGATTPTSTSKGKKKEGEKAETEKSDAIKALEKEAKKRAKEEKKKGKKGAPGTTKERDICPVEDTTTPEGILKLIETNLGFVNDLITQNPKVNALKQEVSAKGDVDMHLAIVGIPGLERRTKHLKELVQNYSNALEKDENKKDKLAKLKNTVLSNALFKTLSTQLDDIKTALDANDDLLKAIPADKRYAYFANGLTAKDSATKLEAPSEKVYKEVAKPASLLQVQKELEEIKKILEIDSTAVSETKDATTKLEAPSEKIQKEVLSIVSESTENPSEEIKQVISRAKSTLKRQKKITTE